MTARKEDELLGPAAGPLLGAGAAIATANVSPFSRKQLGRQAKRSGSNGRGGKGGGEHSAKEVYCQRGPML